MSENHSIILPGCNTAAKAFAVLFFKILAGCNQQIRCRIQLQKFACPLLNEVIRYDKHRLLTNSKPFAFHCCRGHFKRFSCPHTVCKQGVSAIQYPCDRILLVRHQANFRIHAVKAKVAAVILPRSNRIKSFVIPLAQSTPSFWIFPNPVRKSLLDLHLFFLCDGGFFLIQHRLFPAVSVIKIVKHTHIAQI